jgi:4-amino-4-deoxy-L-arabinose transferase-like glycosyltransferase
MGPLSGGRLLLFAAYFASRLYSLLVLPVFLDETLHVRWAREIAEGRRSFARPWEWGRALTVWMGALVTPFSTDLLWANRALSVAAGALALWATIEAGRRLYDDKVGLLAGFFYVVCPFTFFYDRMALADAALSTCAALVLLASVRAAQEGSVTQGVLAGLALLAGVLTKAPGVVLFGIPLGTALLLGASLPGWRAVGAAYLVAAPPAAYALWLFLATRNAERMVDIATENPAGPLSRLLANLGDASGWLWTYWTGPLVVLGLLGLVAAVRARDRRGFLVFALAALPVLGFAALLSRWLPRYLLFTSIPFFVLAAFGFSVLVRRAPRAAAGSLLVLAVLPCLRFDYDLLRDPARARFVPVDRDQFVTSWTSGYGTRDTIALVREELKRNPAGITVVTHVNRFRTLRATPLALSLAFAREPRVRLEDWDLTHPSALPALEKWRAEGPTLVVVPRSDPAIPPPSMAAFADLVTHLATTTKPDGQPADELYRLSPRAVP